MMFRTLSLMHKPQTMLQARVLVQPQLRTIMGGKSKEEKDEDQQNKAFADDINYFLSKEQFNFYDFHERVLVSIRFNKIIF